VADAIVDRLEAGEPIHEVADDFDLTISDVRALYRHATGGEAAGRIR